MEEEDVFWGFPLLIILFFFFLCESGVRIPLFVIHFPYFLIGMELVYRFYRDTL